jgi:hypothetical protein
MQSVTHLLDNQLIEKHLTAPSCFPQQFKSGNMEAYKTSTEAVDQKDFLEGPGRVAEHVEITQTISWTAEEEKKLVRKIDLFLLPNIWLMYLLSYMDRTK